MKRLSSHKRVDKLANDKRVTRPVLGKWLYITSLLILAVSLGNLFFGGYIYFRADGLIVRQPHQIAAGYFGTIQELHVTEGDHVEAGAELARLTSIDIAREQTALTIQLSELATNKANLQSRLAILGDLIPAAKSRADSTRELAAKAREAYDAGLGTNQNLSRLLEDDFDSKSEVIRLKGEAKALGSELQILEQIIADVRASQETLASNYKNGMITAPAAGIVTDVEVSGGSVVNKGDGMMVVLSPPDYILAYLDADALYTVALGDEVSVNYGPKEMTGVVTRVYPLSAVLPLEFQKAFRPKERSQMLRIDFKKSGPPPPLFAKVSVRAPGLVPNWLFDLF